MTLSGKKQNHVVVNAALAALPVNDRGLPELASVKVNVDWHNEAKVADADVHSPVSHFVVGRFFNECRQSAVHISPSPSSNTAEQPGVRALTLVSRKSLNALTVPFLSSAPIERPTVVTSPTLAGET